jgi:hypothetical protein
MFKGYKTYILAGVTTIGAIAGFLVEDITLIQALNLIIPALTGAFVRNGITTALAGKK